MMADVAKVTQVAADIKESLADWRRETAGVLDRLAGDIVEHGKVEGHPAMLRRMADIERAQDEHRKALEAVGSSATQACLALARVTERHDAEDDARKGWWVWMRDKLLTPALFAAAGAILFYLKG